MVADHGNIGSNNQSQNFADTQCKQDFLTHCPSVPTSSYYSNEIMTRENGGLQVGLQDTGKVVGCYVLNKTWKNCSL